MANAIPAHAPRAMDLRIHDTSLGLRQDKANDPSFPRDIFGGLIRHLRDRGWSIGADRDIRRRYPILAPAHRYGRKGALHATLAVSGRAIQFEVWAETWIKDNPSGHRYDFGKRERLSYLDRLRIDLEFLHILAWAATLATVTLKDGNARRVGCHAGGITALEAVTRNYAESWHSDKTHGRPRCTHAHYASSADGAVLTHGATVWFRDDRGRWRRGVAHYNINNMWWVVAGTWERHNLGAHKIFTRPPADPRHKDNAQRRRARLENLLHGAIARMDFERAAVFRDLLFGGEPAFVIWNRPHKAYYRPQSCGYTSDRAEAGRFTRAEVARELRGAPERLTAIAPDGAQLTAADFAASLVEA